MARGWTPDEWAEATGSDPLPTPLVVGPDDYLVVNLGPRASLAAIDGARAKLREQWPDQRILVVSAEDMAVLKSDSPITVERRKG